MGGKRKVAILGSTGTIGLNGLEVCAEAADRFEVVALAGNRSAVELAEQVRAWSPAHVAAVDPDAAAELERLLAGEPGHTRVHAGIDGLLELVTSCGAEVFLIGIAGAACLPATLAAARLGAILALANKESVVMAGPILMREVRAAGATLVPVDSEHSALFQSLAGNDPRSVRRLHLTSSGGPFRNTPIAELPTVTVEQALCHPKWKMGSKITIDSATMMNKALEIVEARWLFDTEADQINVVVHPQAIIHSMVEYVDGSMLAQLGVPDMKVPIRFALGYPERVPADAPGLTFPDFAELTFHEPDTAKFPSLELGWSAARAGGTMGAVLNAANEEAVELFLAGGLRFDRIATSVGEVMQAHVLVADPDLDGVLAADGWARAEYHRQRTRTTALPRVGGQ